MLLIVVLGLIAKLALVSSDCDIGTQKLNDFDMNKVGVIILMYFLHNSIFKTAAFHMFHLRFF